MNIAQFINVALLWPPCGSHVAICALFSHMIIFVSYGGNCSTASQLGSAMPCNCHIWQRLGLCRQILIKLDLCSVALKGAGKRPGTCFTSAAGTALQRLITETGGLERTFGGFLDVNETAQVQMTVRLHNADVEVTSQLCLCFLDEPLTTISPSVLKPNSLLPSLHSVCCNRWDLPSYHGDNSRLSVQSEVRGESEACFPVVLGAVWNVIAVISVFSWAVTLPIWTQTNTWT